jgi:predicted metal-dependent enzyme (double-stranded beta helix superfamily)
LTDGINVTEFLTPGPALSPARLAEIAARTASTPAEWLSLVTYDTSHRWYRRLALHDDYEIWLLSWLPGQGTGFHDHGSSAGAFSVAIGSLEERAVRGGRPATVVRALAQGAIRSFGPDYVHDVRNESAAPAVSVHAYSPPLNTMRRFEETASGLVLASVEVRSW